MAEAILSDLVTSIIESLGSSIFNEIAQFKELKKEAERLGSIVSTIQDVILDAEDQYYSSNNREVKGWVKKLKDALEDADNLLDDINTEALRQQVMGGNNFTRKVRLFFSTSNPVVYGVKMVREIKTIRNRLDEIANERKFHLDTRRVNDVPLVRRKRAETHSFSPHVVVGREDDKKRITELLFSSNQEKDNVSVIAICGIGGLGKTTLAKLVFNDENVKLEFELELWVCISDDFDLKLIVKNILSLSEEIPLNSLIGKLQQMINGKKYLLVLDDVWNEDLNKWLELKDLLMGGRRGSKIIVTTRSMRIASMMGTLPLYELKGLSDKDAWDLFKEKAFRSGCGFRSAKHETIGREILEKCKGVPLAIQTIAATLYLEDTEAAWLAFKDKELRDVRQNDTDIMPTLQLSYNRLPSHLKQCFAFCSLYPKDWNIDIEELIGLWMAQGFVTLKDSSQTMREVGLEYFKDLLWGSFFQDVAVGQRGDPFLCKMHDLMHDLAKRMSGEECVSLGSAEKDDISTKTRHVYVNDHCKFPKFSLEKNKLRTIRRMDRSSDERDLEFIANSRYVRALQLKWVDNFVPGFIFKLNHLRYLDLSGSEKVKKLSNSISRLQNLQILNLDYCYFLEELPKGITKLINLSELHLRDCLSLTHMPCGIGRLTALQVLSTFVVCERRDSARLDELQYLNNLKGDLRIIIEHLKDPEGDCKAANLKSKPHLRSLNLEFRWEGSDSYGERHLEELQPHVNLKSLSVKGYRGTSFPSWISTLTNLVDLSIKGCTNCQSIPPLYHISSLKRLTIGEMPKLETIQIICDSNYYFDGEALFFPSVETIFLYNCPKLKGWERRTTIQDQDYIFSRLSDLNIIDCPNLINWMPSCPSLERLVVYGCNAKSIECLLESAIPSSSFTSVFLSLWMRNISDIQVLPDHLVQHFTSFKTLSILSCPELRSVSQAMRHLTSLEELIIVDCKELDISDIDGHSLKNLRRLEIYNIPKLMVVPEGIQCAIALEKLRIRGCDELELLPEWMGNLTALGTLEVSECTRLDISNIKGYLALKDLSITNIPKSVAIPDGLQHSTSLRSLSVRGCSNFKYLPAWIPNLTSLRRLAINECSNELSERCKGNTAQYWPLISHIPDIYIDSLLIQINGIYRGL